MNLQENINKKTVSFLKTFIRKVLNGKFQVISFGFWSCGQKGKYGLSLYWNNNEEKDGR